MTNYKSDYLKYKNKYLNYKYGGMDSSERVSKKCECERCNHMEKKIEKLESSVTTLTDSFLNSLLHQRTMYENIIEKIDESDLNINFLMDDIKTHHTQIDRITEGIQKSFNYIY